MRTKIFRQKPILEGCIYDGDAWEIPTPANEELMPASAYPSTTNVLCIGASMPHQVFSVMADLANSELKSVYAVNACQGGQDINKWLDPVNKVWSVANNMLLGLRVDVIVMIQDDLRDKNGTQYPEGPDALAAKMNSLIALCESKYPSVKAFVLIDRIYCGWATLEKHAEPAGFLNGIACAKAVSNYTGTRHVNMIDIWTNAAQVRSDGFSIKKSFFNKPDGTFDGVHLGPAGAEAVGRKIYQELGKMPWFA